MRRPLLLLPLPAAGCLLVLVTALATFPGTGRAAEAKKPEAATADAKEADPFQTARELLAPQPRPARPALL